LKKPSGPNGPGPRNAIERKKSRPEEKSTAAHGKARRGELIRKKTKQGEAGDSFIDIGEE